MKQLRVPSTENLRFNKLVLLPVSCLKVSPRPQRFTHHSCAPISLSKSRLYILAIAAETLFRCVFVGSQHHEHFQWNILLFYIMRLHRAKRNTCKASLYSRMRRKALTAGGKVYKQGGGGEISPRPRLLVNTTRWLSRRHGWKSEKIGVRSWTGRAVIDWTW